MNEGTEQTALGQLVHLALDEDVGTGDVTSLATVPASRQTRARIVAKAKGVIAGLDTAHAVFGAVDPSVKMEAFVADDVWRGREVAMNRTTWAVLTVCLLAVIGCNSGSDKPPVVGSELQAPKGLIAQVQPPLPDLPVPVGFKLEEGKSRSFEAAGPRYIDHTYKGRADKFAVKRF